MVLVPHVVKVTLVNSLGLVAGTIVAVAILPQIYRVHRRRRGTDLSITRQVVTGIGATMQITYLVYFGMWAVVIPLSCQLVFLLYLSCLRAYFERPANKREAVAVTEDHDGADTEPSENLTPFASPGRIPNENGPHGHGAAIHDIGQELP